MKTKIKPYNKASPLSGDPVMRPGGVTKVCGKTLAEIQALVDREKEHGGRLEKLKEKLDRLEYIDKALTIIEFKQTLNEDLKRACESDDPIKAMKDTLELLATTVGDDKTAELVKIVLYKFKTHIEDNAAQHLVPGLSQLNFEYKPKPKDPEALALPPSLKSAASKTYGTRAKCCFIGCTMLSKANNVAYCKRHQKQIAKLKRTGQSTDHLIEK